MNIKPGISGVGKVEQRIDRCGKCGKIILRWANDGVIGSPNPHKCEKTYEELLDENKALQESNGWDEEHKYALNQEVYRLMDENQAQAKEIERLNESIKHWAHCYSKLSESKQRLIKQIQNGEEIHFATLDSSENK